MRGYKTFGDFILVTFKPKRREERFASLQLLEERAAVLAQYGVKFQAFKVSVKVVRERLAFTRNEEPT